MKPRLQPNKSKTEADRFHVIKLIIEAFLELCREAELDIRWQRGIAMAHPFKEKEKKCRLLRLKGRTRAGCFKPLRELKCCVDELLHDAPMLFRKLGRTQEKRGLSPSSEWGALRVTTESRRASIAT